MSRLFVTLCMLAIVAGELQADDLSAALSPAELDSVSDAVDRGIAWLATQQNSDGSFNAVLLREEEPALCPTSYAVMAFLSRGHLPGQGSYGATINRAIDFVLSQQREDGSLSTRPPDKLPFRREHPVSALMLCEAYPFATREQMRPMATAIRAALASSRRRQLADKLYPEYRGGWHYGTAIGELSNLSSIEHTAWELTFLRSARNAGFEVPQRWVDEALDFVARCYQPGPLVTGDRRIPVHEGQAVFYWYPQAPPGRPRWADFTTTASGMLALQLHGRREDPMAAKTASWLAARTIPIQGTVPSFYKGTYLWSRAMAQVGGKDWEAFYPRLVRRLLPYQDRDGHWRLDRYIGWGDDKMGPVNYTALSVLALTIPDQLLPIISGEGNCVLVLGGLWGTVESSFVGHARFARISFRSYSSLRTRTRSRRRPR